MVKLTTTLVFLTWAAVAAATNGTLSDREEVIMRKYQSAQVQDRNVDTWIGDYNDTMDDYESKLYKSDGVTINETMICDFAGTLTAQLDLTKEKIQLVKNGLNLTKEQLDDLEVLIEKDEYKDITGLKELLMPYINQHKEKYDADMVRLAEEEADIAAKEKEIEEYKCPCVYEEWSDWSSCSVTCGGGTQTRERGEKRSATNGGDPCSTLGQPDEELPCETQSCPINCQWLEWSEWDMSDQGCNTMCGNGVRTITRARDPPLGTNLHEGIPCDGEDEVTMPCNLLDEAEATAAKQGRQIDMLRLCASDCSTELPASHEPELACTELLPNACSDESKEWIEKTGLNAADPLYPLIWDEYGQDGCEKLFDADSVSYDLDTCKNSCLDDVNNCNAISYLINTGGNDERYCSYFACDLFAEPTAGAAVPIAKAYLYTFPG